MLTDDPGVVGFHQWEINTSVNASVSDNVEVAIPYLDVNYGVANNLQLKVESPYLVSIAHKKVSGNLGEIELGLKFKFLDESKNFVSAGIYPQLVLRGEKGLLVPLLFERTFGKFLVGEDAGVFLRNDHDNNFQSGTLAGFCASQKLQLMAEYFLQKKFADAKGTDGFLNVGFRQLLSETFTLMGSLGTQLTAARGEQKEYFFSFFGLQTHF
jgi:hypothetical protein